MSIEQLNPTWKFHKNDIHIKLPHISKPLFIQIIGFQAALANRCKKIYSDADLRILLDRFAKDSWINRTEAAYLGQMLNIHAEQVFRWFHCQRRKGRLQTVQRETKVLTLISQFFEMASTSSEQIHVRDL